MSSSSVINNENLFQCFYPSAFEGQVTKFYNIDSGEIVIDSVYVPLFICFYVGTQDNVDIKASVPYVNGTFISYVNRPLVPGSESGWQSKFPPETIAAFAITANYMLGESSTPMDKRNFLLNYNSLARELLGSVEMGTNNFFDNFTRQDNFIIPKNFMELAKVTDINAPDRMILNLANGNKIPFAGLSSIFTKVRFTEGLMGDIQMSLDNLMDEPNDGDNTWEFAFPGISADAENVQRAFTERYNAMKKRDPVRSTGFAAKSGIDVSSISYMNNGGGKSSYSSVGGNTSNAARIDLSSDPAYSKFQDIINKWRALDKTPLKNIKGFISELKREHSNMDAIKLWDQTSTGKGIKTAPPGNTIVGISAIPRNEAELHAMTFDNTPTNSRICFGITKTTYEKLASEDRKALAKFMLKMLLAEVINSYGGQVPDSEVDMMIPAGQTNFVITTPTVVSEKVSNAVANNFANSSAARQDMWTSSIRATNMPAAIGSKNQKPMADIVTGVNSLYDIPQAELESLHTFTWIGREIEAIITRIRDGDTFVMTCKMPIHELDSMHRFTGGGKERNEQNIRFMQKPGNVWAAIPFVIRLQHYDAPEHTTKAGQVLKVVFEKVMALCRETRADVRVTFSGKTNADRQIALVTINGVAINDALSQLTWNLNGEEVPLIRNNYEGRNVAEDSECGHLDAKKFAFSEQFGNDLPHATQQREYAASEECDTLVQEYLERVNELFKLNRPATVEIKPISSVGFNKTVVPGGGGFISKPQTTTDFLSKYKTSESKPGFAGSSFMKTGAAIGGASTFKPAPQSVNIGTGKTDLSTMFGSGKQMNMFGGGFKTSQGDVKAESKFTKSIVPTESKFTRAAPAESKGDRVDYFPNDYNRAVETKSGMGSIQSGMQNLKIGVNSSETKSMSSNNYIEQGYEDTDDVFETEEEEFVEGEDDDNFKSYRNNDEEEEFEEEEFEDEDFDGDI